MPWTINGVKYLSEDVAATDDVTAGDDIFVGDDLVVGDKITLTSGGTIDTTANGNITLLPNGTGITIVGDAGSTSHSLTANDDLFVSGKLEVDGAAHFDSGLTTYAASALASNVTLTGTAQFGGSTAANSFFIQRESDDGIHLGIGMTDGQTNGNVIICNNANIDDDYDHSTASTDPTLIIHSAAAASSATDQWVGFQHNGTDPVILAGIGTLTVPTYTKHTSILANAAVLGPNAPTPTTIGTARGLGFDADNESAHLEYEVPDSWDGASDLTFKVYWSGTSGDAIADTEQVKWDVTYRSLAAGEAIDNGTATTATTTYTQSGAGTDKEFITTTITIDYDDANQPLTAGDLIVVQFDRDITGEGANSYSGMGIVYRWEINCSVTKLE